jgi:hypothetical protein
MRTRRRLPSYAAYVVGLDGRRHRVTGQSIVVELQPGIEVEMDLAPHPNFAGQLVLFTPPAQRAQSLYQQGVVDDFAVVFGASNVLHVLVERRTRAAKRRGPRGR